MNWQKVEQLITDGYINVQTHPSLPLKIYNYSAKTQYEFFWTEETLACRGLVTDTENNIVARPFSKFMTYEQLSSVQDKPFASAILDKISRGESFKVYDKMDGSLGLLFNYRGRNIIATRGSFSSEQAIRAAYVLEKKYSNLTVPDGFTLLVEIIYPENRIVCNYGDTEDLFLLAAVETATGKELDIYELDLPFPKVKQFNNFSSFEEICNHQNETDEGFVIKFSDNSILKIKMEVYKRLHKLLTGTNSKTVWEFLSEGRDMTELADQVPDEFYRWLSATKDKFLSQFAEIENIAKAEFRNNFASRKEAADYFKTCKYPHILFSMLDVKDYSSTVWKMLKPKGNEKPFKTDEE